MQTSTVYQPDMTSVYTNSCERDFSSAMGIEWRLRMLESTKNGSSSRLPVGKSSSSPKMTCLCAPTTHAGSFRCRLHRAMNNKAPHGSESQQEDTLSETKSVVTNATGNKSVGKVFSRLSAMEKRSKGESSASSLPLRSKNLNKPSRLSKVTFAWEIKEDSTASPRPAIHPRLSKRTLNIESVSSIRLMALRKCQNLRMEDNLRVKLPDHLCSQAILSQ